MGKENDDPGPGNTIADNDDHLFLGGGATLNKKGNRTMGLFGYVREFASVRRVGMVLPRVGVPISKSNIHIFILAGIKGALVFT
jgi:hypothetical protein